MAQAQMPAPTALATVRGALDIMRERRIRSTSKQRPFVDAKYAVLNADDIDRRTGLTDEGERTPGLDLAHRVLAGLA
jgi:hypothetical protein